LFRFPAASVYLPSFPTRRSSDLNPGVSQKRPTTVSPAGVLFPARTQPHASCFPSHSFRVARERKRHRIFHALFDLRWRGQPSRRSEEHTSELQSRVDLVCRLLLE